MSYGVFDQQAAPLCLIVELHNSNILCLLCSGTLANNQWDLEQELGGGLGWQSSSFYLALRGSGTKGTAMILDEEAKPLQRSWCLFELFQTFQLNEQEPDFSFLFCALLHYRICCSVAA